MVQAKMCYHLRSLRNAKIQNHFVSLLFTSNLPNPAVSLLNPAVNLLSKDYPFPRTSAAQKAQMSKLLNFE